MSELSELYQSLILDHQAKPRNFGSLAHATHQADGHNPLCGDQLHVELEITNDTIADVRFAGIGCAISKASASLMTTAIKGKSLQSVQQLFKRFHTLLTAENTTNDDFDDLGKLAVFSGVRQYPVRVKCATLCWHTLQAAIQTQSTPATTE